MALNDKNFQNLKQQLGICFINYILNKNGAIRQDTKIDECKLSIDQIAVLENLDKELKTCFHKAADNGSFHGMSVDLYLESLTHEDDCYFNHYRRVCGGDFPDVNKDDKILGFLQTICIREYPNLIRKPISSYKLAKSGMNSGKIDYEIFSALIRGDILNTLTNDKKGLDYAFSFKVSENLAVDLQVALATRTLIEKSFFICCMRMSYTLEDVLEEISKNVEMLRSLARGEAVEYSSFTGIKGLHFDGFNDLDLNGNTIRQIDDISNPSYHTKSIVIGHADKEKGEYYSGQIIETRHETQVEKIDPTKSYYHNAIPHNEREKVLECLQFAIIFSVQADRGFATTFVESGFPLLNPGNYSMGEDQPYEGITVTEEQSKEVLFWFELLLEKDLTNLKVPLKRLKYAIFSRRDPQDSILDAIISWEGMFSGSSETTFKITGSIAKYLKPDKERAVFLKHLEDLYSLRSYYVHGKTKKRPLKNVDDYEIRKEVIQIGLACLMKLLKDDGLLPLSPSDRVKKLLIL